MGAAKEAAMEKLRGTLGASVVTPRAGTPSLRVAQVGDRGVRLSPIQTKEVRVDLIDADPNQQRSTFDPDELVALNKSVRKHQDQPLTLIAIGDRFLCLDGERRLRAATLKGIETAEGVERIEWLRSEIWAKRPTEAEIRWHRLAITLHRAGLAPLEEAAAFKALLDLEGCNQSELAERLDIPRARVSIALKRLEMPEFMQGAIAKGDLHATTADELRGLPAPQAEKIARDAIKNKSSREEVRAKIAAVKAASPEAKREDGAAGESGLLRGATKPKRAWEQRGRLNGGAYTVDELGIRPQEWLQSSSDVAITQGKLKSVVLVKGYAYTVVGISTLYPLYPLEEWDGDVWTYDGKAASDGASMNGNFYCGIGVSFHKKQFVLGPSSLELMVKKSGAVKSPAKAEPEPEDGLDLREDEPDEPDAIRTLTHRLGSWATISVLVDPDEVPGRFTMSDLSDFVSEVRDFLTPFSKRHR